MIEKQLLSSFSGKLSRTRLLAGNQHLVTVVETHSGVELGKQKSLEYEPLIYVELSSEPKGQPSLRFYHRGYELKNCGSGTLAAAKVFFDLNPQFNAAEFHTLSGMNTSNKFHDLIGYSRRNVQITCASICDKRLVSRLLQRPVDQLHKVGASNGYWIAELQSETAIQNLRPHLAILKRMYKPALIVTARASKNANYDYVMRYFAPQYGNAEDAATGSANMLLIQYWWSRMQKPLLHGIQLSKLGGEFFGLCRANKTEIYGRVG